tara:strand:+ start:1440 stop:1862 length:423 start_codon:yes stop_codon:yes gene_type:complete
MYKFGTRSSENLATCEGKLQQVVTKVMSYNIMDFSVICGHRSLEQQAILFKRGLTQIDGVKQIGMHNYAESKAVDLLPYPSELNGVNVWEDIQRFSVLNGLMQAAAIELGYKIRWGGDWDGDGNNGDSKFTDMPHYEIIY